MITETELRYDMRRAKVNVSTLVPDRLEQSPPLGHVVMRELTGLGRALEPEPHEYGLRMALTARPDRELLNDLVVMLRDALQTYERDHGVEWFAREFIYSELITEAVADGDL
jgi:hypothetical protein